MKFKDWQHLERKASWEDMIGTTLGQKLKVTLLLEENHPRPGGSGLPALRCHTKVLVAHPSSPTKVMYSLFRWSSFRE